MTRGRKSQYVNKLTTRDQNMLRAFHNVGYLHKEQLKQELGMSERRIENFCRDGHIESVEVFDKRSKSIQRIYCLTEKGKEFVQQQMNLCNFYRSVSVRHDLALAQKYFECTKEQQQSWITERDWKDRVNQEIERLKSLGDQERANQLEEMRGSKTISLPDGGYVEGEKVVAVEIITENYKQSEVQAKEEFTNVMQTEYQPYKI